MSSKYFLKLDQFEGPLDLLLYLIRDHEIDIFDIDIFLLTNQYLNFLRLVKFDDLADAGEFLEMAATLIEIKSRMLLPKEKGLSADGDMFEDDPRKSLADRLIAYELFKAAGEYLGAMPQLGVQFQSGKEWVRLQEIYKDVESPVIGDPASLVVLYEQMIRDMKDRKPSVVSAKMHMVTVEEKIVEVRELVTRVRFTLFQSFYHKFNSRYEFVVYLLAILELVKMGEVKLYQQELMGPLWVYRADLTTEQLPLQTPQLPSVSSTSEVSPATSPLASQEGNDGRVLASPDSL